MAKKTVCQNCSGDRWIYYYDGDELKIMECPICEGSGTIN